MVGAAVAAQQQQPAEPVVGQPGRDAVWVPTSPELVERMLDMARVTPKDVVMDLGSGDGRMIIAAAKRGARAIGVEFNNDLVEFSRKLARDAGVGDRATFVQGDMFEADISKATVLALFLLPENLEKLKDKFLALAPGTRIVLNTLDIPGWEPDAQEVQPACVSWCMSILHIVPAKVAGAWQLGSGALSIEQHFQKISGNLTSGGSPVPLTGRLRGDQITFSAGGAEYVGRVAGDRIEGSMRSGGTKQDFTAMRKP
jgi:SAM-dependent methyltransferase